MMQPGQPSLRGRLELPHADQLWALAVFEDEEWGRVNAEPMKLWEALEFSRLLRLGNWIVRIGPAAPV